MAADDDRVGCDAINQGMDAEVEVGFEEARLVECIKAICAEWPCYGYRRVTAELHARGCLVNHKKVMRLMQEHGLIWLPLKGRQ